MARAIWYVQYLFHWSGDFRARSSPARSICQTLKEGDVREEPVPHLHQEWKHAQESTGKFHPEPSCVGHSDSPD